MRSQTESSSKNPKPKKLYTLTENGEKREINHQPPNQKNPRQIPYYYYSIGFYLLTPLLLGVIIGVFLRDYTGLGDVAVLVSILIGGAISIYHLYKIVTDDAAPHQH